MPARLFLFSIDAHAPMRAAAGSTTRRGASTHLMQRRCARNTSSSSPNYFPDTSVSIGAASATSPRAAPHGAAESGPIMQATRKPVSSGDFRYFFAFSSK
ncbi:hypothetical protein [Burkholderia sp. PU8-34]